MIKRLLLIASLGMSTLVYSQAPNWTVNEGAFQQSQTIICKLNMDGKYLVSKNDMVAAFVGNQCRGVGKPVFIPSLNRYLTYFTIFSNNQGDSIRFKLYDSNSGKIADAVNKFTFSINAQIGSAFQSYVVSNIKLNNEAKISGFSFPNNKIDSTKTVTDLITGALNTIFYIPIGSARDNLSPTFTISSGANAYINELPIVSGVSKIDFTRPVVIQVLSEDESNLTNFNVEVKNSVITDLFNIDQTQFINIGPNPFYSTLNIDYRFNASSKLNIEIRNMYDGSLIYQQKNIIAGTKLNLDQVSSGMYLCIVYSLDGKYRYQFKLVKI
jgi:hypothetical protein